MKRLCALMVTAAALIASSFIPVASAEPTGPLAGLEALCLKEGGRWSPYEVEGLGKVVCFGPEFFVPSWTQLTNYQRLCKAAGYSGFVVFGRGIPVPGIYVYTWACV
jgi:hypothetical protein